MKLTIDTDQRILTHEADGQTRRLPLYSDEAFGLLSDEWLKVGWNQKYSYTFTWLGRPIIQLPDDMFRMQEVVYRVKPDVLVETGVAHGGSLVFYASLFKAMGKGRVIAVDVDIRQANRRAIETHDLAHLISLIECSSTDEPALEQVRSQINTESKVLVVLDSNHSKQHVLRELTMYGPLVSPGSYIVACDGIMKRLVGTPRSHADWGWNNPVSAVQEFLTDHNEFVLDEPEFSFNEGHVRERVTYWPNAFLRRVR